MGVRQTVLQFQVCSTRWAQKSLTVEAIDEMRLPFFCFMRGCIFITSVDREGIRVFGLWCIQIIWSVEKILLLNGGGGGRMIDVALPVSVT